MAVGAVAVKAAEEALAVLREVFVQKAAVLVRLLVSGLPARLGEHGARESYGLQEDGTAREVVEGRLELPTRSTRPCAEVVQHVTSDECASIKAQYIKWDSGSPGKWSLRLFLLQIDQSGYVCARRVPHVPEGSSEDRKVAHSETGAPGLLPTHLQAWHQAAAPPA